MWEYLNKIEETEINSNLKQNENLEFKPEVDKIAEDLNKQLQETVAVRSRELTYHKNRTEKISQKLHNKYVATQRIFQQLTVEVHDLFTF